MNKSEKYQTGGKHQIGGRQHLSGKYQIDKKDRTLTALSNLDGRVYVYCSDRRTLQKFIEDAENEYFRYGDGVSLMEREPEHVMALNWNRTVNYIGYIGHVAYRTADRVGDQTLIRVDYRKYAAGEKDFICPMKE